MIKLAIALLVVALPFGGVGEALPIGRVDYAFTVTSTFGGFPAPVTIEGVALFDLAGSGSLMSHTVSFGSTILNAATNSGGQFFSAITIQDQVPFVPPRDRFSLHSSFNFQTSGIDVQSILFNLEGPESIFSGNALFLPNPADFTILKQGFVSFLNGSQSFGAGANLSSIEFSLVSEPGSEILVLFTVGLVGLVVWRRWSLQPRKSIR